MKLWIFGGRLAESVYYDMHQVIASALADSWSSVTRIRETLCGSSAHVARHRMKGSDMRDKKKQAADELRPE